MIYYNYIFKKIIQYIVIILSALTLFIFFSNFSNLSISKAFLGVDYTFLFKIISIQIPLLMFQITQYAFFLGIFLGLNIIFNSNEFIIFKSSGISNRKIFRILLSTGIIIFMFNISLTFFYPTALKQYYSIKMNLNSKNIFTNLKPKVLNNIGNYNIYFENIEKGNILTNVVILIRANKDNKIIEAEKMIINDNGFDIIFQLQNAKLYSIRDDNSPIISTIKEIDLSLNFLTNNAKTQFQKTIDSPKILTNSELHRKCFIENNCKINEKTEMHNRILIPLNILGIVFLPMVILILKKISRTSFVKYNIFAILSFAYLTIVRFYGLEFLINKNIVFIAYLNVLVFILGGSYILFKSDRNNF